MGLTNQSTGAGVLESELKIERTTPDDRVILDSRLLITRISCTSNKINGLSDYVTSKLIVMLKTRNESAF